MFECFSGLGLAWYANASQNHQTQRNGDCCHFTSNVRVPKVIKTIPWLLGRSLETRMRLSSAKTRLIQPVGRSSKVMLENIETSSAEELITLFC